MGFTFAGSYSHVDIAFATLATWQELRYGDSANGRFSAVAIQASDGVVFQSANLFPSLTALQQLELVAHIDGRLDGAARTRANELLVTVGLGSRLNARPAQLSGGEQRRVGIARALMSKPALLLADEPTPSLDAERGEAVKNLLVEQATERGAATLIVTHLPDQIATSRTLAIERGRVTELTPAGAS